MYKTSNNAACIFHHMRERLMIFARKKAFLSIILSEICLVCRDDCDLSMSIHTMWKVRKMAKV